MKPAGMRGKISITLEFGAIVLGKKIK